MRIEMRTWVKHFAVGLLSLLSCTALFYHLSLGEDLVTVTAGIQTAAEPSPTVVIDAGHGGEDCGAVGVSGVFEKELNYKIATYLSAELRSAGCEVIETRTKDALLYDPATVEKGHKKLTDLSSRLAIASATPGAIAVSIHMNSFPSPSSHGLQVWYSPGQAGAKDLAEKIQRNVTERLQPDNHRKVKASTGSIYLLDRAENPTVLIECGFLTNPEECARLESTAYQKELSFVIFGAIMEYIQETL